MPEPIILVLGLLLAGAAVLAPLLRAPQPPAVDAERDSAAVRHRVALETLRDVGADHRAGSLDDRGYAEQRAEAEARAAATRAALDTASDTPPLVLDPRGRAVTFAAAALIGAALLGGSLIPATGIANRTSVNRGLADAQATERARQDRIGELLDALAGDPRNPATLSDLADTYLAGSTRDDLVRAAVALQLLIDLEPDRNDAYERIMSAYLRAGDYVNARSVEQTYAGLEGADAAEVAFFDGLIALRGEDDPARAVEAFDRFLDLAPHDPRAGMIRGLRDEAAAAER